MKNRFGTALTLTLVIFTLLPVTILGTALVRQASETIRTNSERDLQLVASNISDRIAQQLSTSRILMQNLAGETDMFLATRSTLFWRDARGRMADFLDSSPLVASIALIDMNNNVVVAIPEPAQIPAPAFEVFPGARALLARVPSAGKLIFDSETEGNSLFLSTLIRSQSGIPGTSRLLVEIPLARIHQNAAKVLSDGLVLELSSGSLPQQSSQIDRLVSATGAVPDGNLRPENMIYFRITDKNANRIRAIQDTVTQSVSVIAVLAIVAAVLAFWVARSFLSPLSLLLRRVEQLSSPEDCGPVPSYRFYEFQLLGERIAEQKNTIARQFEELNQTVQNLRDLGKRHEEMRNSAERAQLKALEAQMNPHMLFNTLNSILSMIDIDVVCAGKMISDLADLYRMIMAVSKRPISDVATEVAIASRYLELERLRFEDRMEYHIDVVDSALTLPIPGLVLQTLVENAVKHGIAKSAMGGRVELSIRAAGAGVHVVRIANTGSPLGGVSGNGGGTGLENTRRRLELLYGKDHDFQVFTHADQTVAQFFMREPQHEAENSDC